MERLWAPWRTKYILNPKKEGCIFCKKPKEERDNKNYILKRGNHAFVMMNIYPYNNGHLMIAPYKHTGNLEELTPEELNEMMEMVVECIKILKETMNPDGFNVGMNIGRVAGAGFDEHVHIHIVPRWNGDTNFMPILADTKIVPMSLDEAYRVLKQKFD